MPDRGTRAPARDWYDLVIQTIALKNMTKAQLASRSGVSRATIDRWEKGASRPAQAASVNAVADALGIPRERALRLAGIIAGGGGDAGRSPPVPPAIAESVRLAEGLTDEDRARVLEAIAATLRGDPPSTGPGAADPSPGERRAG